MRGITSPKLSVLLILPMLTTEASTPIQHGTAVAFAANDTTLVLAADSHLQLDGNQTVANDSGCKIIKLTDNSILGVSGFEETPDHRFSAVREGKTLFTRDPPKTIDEMVARGLKWGYVASDQIGRLLAGSQSAADRATKMKHPTVGTFAAFMPRYGLFVEQVTIRIFAKADGVHTTVTQQHFKPTSFRATGWGETIYDEILAQSTPRSKQAAWLIPLFKSHDLADMKRATLALVGVGKAWAPTSINGEIDQVQLDKSGVHWIHLKPSCSAD